MEKGDSLEDARAYPALEVWHWQLWKDYKQETIFLSALKANSKPLISIQGIYGLEKLYGGGFQD